MESFTVGIGLKYTKLFFIKVNLVGLLLLRPGMSSEIEIVFLKKLRSSSTYDCEKDIDF
jgi:hypothetical protein